MINLPEEKNIYSEIQKKLFYIIPEKWESIYLYASAVQNSNKRITGEMYFYYFPKGIIKKKPVNCYEIPNTFNIDENEYAKLITNLYNTITKLRTVWFKKTNKVWTNLTISIENYQFKIEFDYQDLQSTEFDSYERHVIWRYLYLKPELHLLSKKERKIINKYMDFVDTNKIVKKDMYIEGLYRSPVQNIVDYEKTLSVEEAIARAENDDRQKTRKKTSFFKKKHIIKDIVEVEDDEEINNQILNWKKK